MRRDAAPVNSQVWWWQSKAWDREAQENWTDGDSPQPWGRRWSISSIIIIIIAFKGAIRGFLQSPHSAANCLQHVRSSVAQSCAKHVQHIKRFSRASVMLRATWYEGTAQLLSLTELKLHLFEFYFIGWTIKPMKEGRKPEYPEKTPGDELQKMPHTTARRFKPQARLEPMQ